MTTKVKWLPCDFCPKPFLELNKGADGITRIVFVVRHDSEKHRNVFTVEQLLQVVREFEESEQRDRMTI